MANLEGQIELAKDRADPYLNALAITAALTAIVFTVFFATTSNAHNPVFQIMASVAAALIFVKIFLDAKWTLLFYEQAHRKTAWATEQLSACKAVHEEEQSRQAAPAKVDGVQG